MNSFLLEYILSGELYYIAYCMTALFEGLFLFYPPLAKVWYYPKILCMGSLPPHHFYYYFPKNCKIQQSSPDFAFSFLL